MNTNSPIDVPHGDEVTTEPQRLALEAMSNDLVRKLNAMVAEQEQRAREFAAQQHSLSSLPTLSVPEVAEPVISEIPVAAPQQTGIKARIAPQYRSEERVKTAPPPPTRKLPEVPKAATNQEFFRYNETRQVNTTSAREYKMPTIIRDTGAEKKEGTIGAGTIATIIFILFILIMQGCE